MVSVIHRINAAFCLSNKFVPYRPNYDLVCAAAERTIAFGYNSTNSYKVNFSAAGRSFIMFGYVQGIGNVFWAGLIVGSGALMVKNLFDGSDVSNHGITWDSTTFTGTFTSSSATWSSMTVIRAGF